MANPEKLPILLLLGPTAVGKSDVAIRLAERYPVGLISVDSALVYRGMNIGTAKPEPNLLQRVPHALVDILDPAESYSAARFRQDALNEIRRLHQLGQIPLLVGGTMLYFQVLQQGLSRLPDADPQIRAQLTTRYQQEGLAALHRQLTILDAEAGKRIHPNDKQRIFRALEICLKSGRGVTELYATMRNESLPYRILKVIMAPADRSLLHQRIEARFHAMLEQGFIDEVAKLRQRDDLHLELPAMRAVGYRQVWQHLEGSYSYAEMIQRGIAATRQFAKRQLTWLRPMDDAHWLDSSGANMLDRLMRLAHDQGFLEVPRR